MPGRAAACTVVDDDPERRRRRQIPKPSLRHSRNEPFLGFQEPKPEQEEEAKAPPALRWLELSRVAAARAVVCLAGLYGLAKSRAGPLRPAVDAVDSAVARAVGPIYNRFRDTPLALLIFFDRKIDIFAGFGRIFPVASGGESEVLANC